jgi:hypothetical protein
MKDMAILTWYPVLWFPVKIAVSISIYLNLLKAFPVMLERYQNMLIVGFLEEYVVSAHPQWRNFIGYNKIGWEHL